MGPAGETGAGFRIISQGGPPGRGGLGGDGKGFGSGLAAASARTAIDSSAAPHQGSREDRPGQILDATSERWSDAPGGDASSSTIPLDHRSLLGSLDIAFRSSFKYQSDALYGGGQTSSSQTPASGGPASALQRLIQDGTRSSFPFSQAPGNQLDLNQILHGAPAMHDLTHIEQLAKILDHGPKDPSAGHGAQSAPQISGSSDQAIVHPQGSARADLQDLVKHDDLIPPSS